MLLQSFNYHVYNEYCIPLGHCHPKYKLYRDKIKLSTGDTYISIAEFFEKSVSSKINLNHNVTYEQWIDGAIKIFITDNASLFPSNYKYSTFIDDFEAKTSYKLQKNYYQTHMNALFKNQPSENADSSLPHHYKNLNFFSDILIIIKNEAVKIMNYYANEHQLLFKRKAGNIEQLVGYNVSSSDVLLQLKDGSFESQLRLLYEKVLYNAYFFVFQYLLFYTKEYSIIVFSSHCFNYMNRVNSITFGNVDLPMYDYFFEAFAKKVTMRNSKNFYYKKIYNVDKHIFENLDKQESFSFLLTDSIALFLLMWHVDAFKTLYSFLVKKFPYLTMSWLTSKISSMNFLISHEYIKKHASLIPPAANYVDEITVDIPILTKGLLWYQSNVKAIARNMATNELLFILVAYKKFVDLQYLTADNINSGQKMYNDSLFRPQLGNKVFLDKFINSIIVLISSVSSKHANVKEVLELTCLLLTPGVDVKLYNDSIININPEYPADVIKHLDEFWNNNKLATLAYSRLQLFINPTVEKM